MSHIYLSYSNDDYAHKLASFIRQHGFNTWMDREPSGVNSWRVKVEGIQSCAALVFIMSSESSASVWVQREVLLALAYQKPIVPLLLSGGNWPIFDLSCIVNVRDGEMPGEEFYRCLAASVIPTQKRGQDRTVKANDDLVPYDVYHSISRFFEAVSDKNWARALECVGQIAASGEDPTLFDLGEFEAMVRGEIEQNFSPVIPPLQSLKEKQYDVLRQLYAYLEPEQASQALDCFWEHFPGYDPDNLAERYVRSKVTPSPVLERSLFLAEKGDSRPGVGLREDGLPDISWVEIPEGEFIYQQHESLYLETFYLAKLPITNRQFRAFIDADDGYFDGRWWDGLAERPTRPEVPQWSGDNFPRENVNWYEAVAFCRWLSYRLTGNIPHLDFPQVWPVRLPLEYEWERAARGFDGRIYPWGRSYKAGYANVDESRFSAEYIGQTTAVGMYLQGATQEGVLDMSGNVWEWTLNEYGVGENLDLSKLARRVVRGGSWKHSSASAKVTIRQHFSAVERHPFIGFRVCTSRL
ncbi:MAG: SUMF1/EgtB/PvdO family nonheme iron enzyme [Anaerolineae bacterium]|nr:MAG: SUMF1/EgtB/PvdO family nonheme iron enzyme [Anaerolineae bacterium]